ncbi:transcription antitermination factor NusB [Klebsiella pneumoniae]|nr:transcription antitermination factor NusB [Klebsiella pneumoniae]
MKPAARRRARECAVQALYSWQLSHNDIADVEYQFLAEQDVKDVDVLYFRELLSGVATNSAYLDGLMKPYLSRQLEELGQVEKAVLRIALGSATVAAITAGGIAAPLIATTGVSPELMVIAVGSGSVIFSHVNDPGFWLFKEYFNLTIGETIKSWSVLETIISVCGLVGCLLLGMVV